MNWTPPQPIDTSPENRARLSGPGLRPFLNIARVWTLELTEVQQLLGMPAAEEFQSWCDLAKSHNPLTLTTDILLRISAVLGIYQSLRIICGSEEEGRQWLQGPSRGNLFNGRSPLELMLSGFEPGLMDVRGYLLAQEQGAERDLAHAPHQLDEAGGAGQVLPQRERVDEQPDDPFKLGTDPTGERRADDEVLLAGVAMQEGAEAREQAHEQGDVLLAAQVLDGLGDVGRESERVRVALEAMDGRTRPIHGQLQEERRAGELVAPIAQQSLQPVVPEPLPLPGGELDEIGRAHV